MRVINTSEMDGSDNGLEVVVVHAGIRGIHRAAGSLTPGQLAYTINGVLCDARRLPLREVVVNIRDVRGFESPAPAYRRWAAEMWAATAAPYLRVAMVARQEYVCPQKTGVLAANVEE